MKAAPFEYVRAESIDHALSLLDELGGDVKLVAGGQSLVPMMAMRLVRPSVLVDINHIDALRLTTFELDGVHVGAGRRQCLAQKDPVLSRSVPLIARALQWIGHIQTRNRGTVGGSVAHADPAAELPVVAQMLDATLRVRSRSGTRNIAANDFFTGPMSTALESNECLESIFFPTWPEDHVGSAFDEISIRHGDFAIVAVGAQIALAADGRITRAAIGVGGAGPTPLTFPAISATMFGERPSDALLASVSAAIAAAVDPGNDLHATIAYRRHLTRTLVGRTMRAAIDNAAGIVPKFVPGLAP